MLGPNIVNFFYSKKGEKKTTPYLVDCLMEQMFRIKKEGKYNEIDFMRKCLCNLAQRKILEIANLFRIEMKIC